MASIFTKIINREIPSHIVAENEEFIAILDINPVKPGHTLVITKAEVDKIYDNTDGILSKILLFAKPICLAIEQATGCERVGMVVYGKDVPHTHLHLIPLHVDMHFGDMGVHESATNEELREMNEKLQQYLAAK